MSFKKHLRIGPTAPAATAIVLVVLSMIAAPVYLTKDLPNRKPMKANYSKTESLPEITASFEQGDGNGAGLQNPLSTYR